MASACASLIHCICELIFLAVITWTCVFCEPLPGPKLKVAYLGLSFDLSCPVDNPENYNFTFFLKKPFQSQTTKLDINGTNRFKQDKSILTITKVIFDDGGVYSCEVRNQSNYLVKTINLGHVFVNKVPVFEFKLYPEKPSIRVNEGSRFMLRCEYGKVNTTIIWRRISQMGSDISKVIPREKIFVKNDAQKQIEFYVIEKISLDDGGAYQCEVMEGSKSKFTHVLALQVVGNKKPAFERSEDVINTSERKLDFEINLEVVGEPSPNITCSIGGKEIISCSGKTIAESTIHKNSCKRDNFEITIDYYLLITEVFYSEHHGNYSCVATNIVGSANTTFTVDVTVRPTISKRNSEFFYHQEKKKGIVTCTIREANPRPVINWYSQELQKIDDNPNQNNWVRSNLKQRLTSFPGGKYESTLTIPANQGKSFYMCNVTNSAGSSSRVYKFLRYSRGKNPVVVTPSNTVERNEGETFVAECRVVNSITGKIVFFKENSVMEIVNKTRTKITLRKGSEFRKLTMTIVNLTVNDSGTYRCTEEKLTNEKASVNLKVNVLRPTKIFSLRNETVTESPRLKSVELFCNISGNPLPEVTWLKNDKIFKPTDLTEDNCKSIQPGYYHYKNPYKLIICKPRRIDTGFYTCLAKNQLANASRKAYLNVLSAPKIKSPQLLKKEKKNKGERYAIRCTAVGNPSPLVQWVKNNSTTNNSKLSITFSDLVIESMDESDEGNYSCRAKNRLRTVQKRLLEIEMIPTFKTIPQKSSGLSTGGIIGIIFGVLVFVTIALILCLIWLRFQRRKMLFYKHQYFLKTGEYSVDPTLTLNEQSLNLTYDSDWEFPFKRLTIGDRLGAGAFGEVFKAEAMGILSLNARDKSGAANKRRSKLRRTLRASQRAKKRASSDPANATVAVKTVKATATESEIRDLAAELKLMIHLGQHKNIVNLLGACTTGRKLYVILEFCPHGNLLSFLREKRDLYDSTWVKEVFDPEKEFTLIDLVGAAFQVAKGMEFLSERKLIHRDLAARNILVGDQYVMKISDFGLARDIYKDDVYVKTSSGLLPVKWMAIESLFDRVYTHQSDVWAFGVLLWEMMTLGGTPYPGLPAEELLDYLHNGKRMQQPAKCPLEVYTIMRDCWQEEPEQRPTFSGLVEHLGRMLERHMAKDNPYLQVVATSEEMEAAKERDLLLQSKSDYYLQPLLLTTKYDANAPLPTPPTDVATPTYTDVGEPEFDKKAEPSKMNASGSYELLREDEKPAGENAQPLKVSLDKESGVALQDMNGKDSKAPKPVKHTETVV